MVNEGVIMKGGKLLFSSNQIRAHHHKVFDTPKRYGGKQSIQLFDDIVIPLTYLRGLCGLKIRLPTKDELEILEPFELTSGIPWDPSQSENDDFEPEEYTDTTMQINEASVQGVATV